MQYVFACSSRRNRSRRITLRLLSLFCPLLCIPAIKSSAEAPQAAIPVTAATVTVNAASGLGTIPSTAVGVNTAVWDGGLMDSAVPGLLSQAGITTLRYPGGSTSDVYHWQTHSLTGGGWVTPGDNFDNFMGIAQQVGASPIITVNYGSNAAGTAGGDPNEAAAWVDYANNTKKYGVKYWEIGNEIYGNAEYGGNWEEDLHPDQSPYAYGSNVAIYADAMKAKDPTIKIGAVLTSPGDWPDGQSPDWNTNVLAACGTKIDFVIVHWYAQQPGYESDAGLLASPGLLPAKVAKVRALISQYCGPNASKVQIFVTETNSVSFNPGKQSVSTVNALFAADDYMTWLENGVANVDWWDLHNGETTGTNNSGDLFGTANYGDYGLLSSGYGDEPAADTPFASYFAIQMLTHLGGPGDQMVTATSSQPLLSVHAVKQANGKLALLLVNKSAVSAYAARIAVSGYTPSKTSTVYTYNSATSAIVSRTSRAGSSFLRVVPPYSLVTTVLSGPPVKPTVPVWTAETKATPAAISPSAVCKLTTLVEDTGTDYENAIVDVEVYDSSGKQVSQKYYTGQNFAAGGVRRYPWSWTAPSVTGSYTVTEGIFSSDWSQNLYWNSSAAIVTVNSAGAPDTAQYNFESGVQGWATSGSLISGVSTSSAQAFAGNNSLAVQFAGTAGGGQTVGVSAPATTAGQTVTFHVWIPSGGGITAIQPYVQQGSSGGWVFTGNYQTAATLHAGAWNTLTVTVPASAVTPLFQLGVQFFTSDAWSGTCYVDAVSW